MLMVTIKRCIDGMISEQFMLFNVVGGGEFLHRFSEIGISSQRQNNANSIIQFPRHDNNNTATTTTN